MAITAARNMAAVVDMLGRNHTPCKAESRSRSGTGSGARGAARLGDGGGGLDMCQ